MIITIHADGTEVVEATAVSVALDADLNEAELLYDMDVHPRLAIADFIGISVDDAGPAVGGGH